jgi:4'-phosphopantetheinyl transferase
MIDPAAVGWGILAPYAGEWRAAGHYALGQPGDVHVYMVSLRHDEALVDAYEQILSPVEKQRADRFHFAPDRARYIAAHGALREIVGAYAEIPAAAISFQYSPHGKPALHGTNREFPVAFNMSHSGEVALVAVSGSGPLGIDVERVPGNVETEDLAPVCCSRLETAILAELPLCERAVTLYRWWTRKEALAKALGEGLSRPLRRYQVVPPYLSEENPGRGANHPWGVWDISPLPGYVATLVADSPERTVVLNVFESPMSWYPVLSVAR